MGFRCIRLEYLALACRILLSLTLISFLVGQTQARAQHQWRPSVVGIDFGSQFIKISYVAPRELDPFPILLNDMSERKTINAVAFRNGKPFLGPHAVKPILNQPERGYMWLNTMLGRDFEDPIVQQYLSKTVAQFVRDPQRGTVLVKTLKEELAPVEYLAGMLLAKLVPLVDENFKKRDIQAVITVPPYFGQAQRQAVLDAAKIAGLKVLSLTNDVSAAALFHGVSSSSVILDPRFVIIIDSGATHTSAALVHIHPNHSENGKNATLVEINRTVSDMELNGLSIDQAVAKVLARKFSEMHGGLEVPLGKAYNRLLEEASKVKHILSANTEIKVNIEELVGNHHMSCIISRKELEAECANLHTRASELVARLLGESKFTVNDIAQIIPIGGNNRVPFIQDDLKGKYGDKFMSILNMDETAAQGAARYAAMLAGFLGKPVRFRDSYPHAVSLHYRNSTSTSIPEAKPNVVSIYSAHSFLDGHKGVAFKNMTFIDFVVSTETKESILEATVDGVPSALESLKDRAIVSHKLKFWVDLNSSGIIEFKDQPIVLVDYEMQEPKVSAPTEVTGNDAPPVEPVSPPQFETVVKTESLPLKYSVKLLFNHMPAETISYWAQTIEKSHEAEGALARRSAARNKLEENMYRLRDRLEEEGFISISRPEERTNLESLINKANDLLEEDEEGKLPENYEQMLNNLLQPEMAIEHRKSENERRPAIITKMKKQIELVRQYAQKMLNDFPNPNFRAQTDEELGSLGKKAEDLGKWLAEVESLQSNLEAAADPVILCSVFEERTSDLARVYTSILMKKLPPPPPPPSPNESPNAVENELFERQNAQTTFDTSQPDQEPKMEL